MAKRQTGVRGHVIVGLAGACVGAAAVALGTDAMPKLMQRMMEL